MCVCHLADQRCTLRSMNYQYAVRNAELGSPSTTQRADPQQVAISEATLSRRTNCTKTPLCELKPWGSCMISFAVAPAMGMGNHGASGEICRGCSICFPHLALGMALLFRESCAGILPDDAESTPRSAIQDFFVRVLMHRTRPSLMLSVDQVGPWHCPAIMNGKSADTSVL